MKLGSLEPVLREIPERRRRDGQVDAGIRMAVEPARLAGELREACADDQASAEYRAPLLVLQRLQPLSL
jgi:hypothetical protein